MYICPMNSHWHFKGSQDLDLHAQRNHSLELMFNMECLGQKMRP